MISVVVIGYGNVGYHLVNAFLKSEEVNVVQVYNRSIKKIAHLNDSISVINNLKHLKKADIYIVAVSDDVIAEVSLNIDVKNAFVVHTSGATSINELKNNGRKGVFYMLQSFSKDKKNNFDEIPFCLEADTDTDLILLEKLALSIGKKIYRINSEQRKHLHVAAVFVNNFTNHLYKIGSDICKKNGISFDILHPLIKETVLKIEHLPPTQAQTGPAKRNDNKTIKNHLNLLSKEQQTIYKLLTKSIQNG